MHALPALYVGTTLVVLAISAPIAAQKEVAAASLRIIGTPHGYVMSFPVAINRRGDLAGDTSHAPGPQVPFFWSEDDGFVLFTNGISGSAYDMNDASSVVGAYFPSTERGYLWSPKDGFTDLGDFFPRAINNRGDIVGNCGLNVVQACLRDATGAVTDIVAEDPSVQLWPIEVNDHGAVIGSFLQGVVSGDFYWSAATGVILNPPPPLKKKNAVLLPTVNRRGVVVGQAISDSGYSAYAWRPSDGSALNLHDPTIGSESYAMAINDRNQVTGFFLIDGWPIGAVWQLPKQWVR